MIRLLAIFLAVPVMLMAQAQDSVHSAAHLSILSDPPGAEVRVDSAVVGRTPISSMEVSAGTHQLSLASPSFSDWNAIIRNESVQLGSGEALSVSYDFGTTLNIVTIPSGVTVSYEGRSLGTTPLSYRSSVPLNNILELRKDGFRRQELPPGSIRGIITMGVVDASVAASEIAIAPSVEESASPWAEYVSAAGMVVSGVAAAYFKHQANAHFDTFRRTGNAASLEDTRRYDGYSAASLVVTQISFAVLAYLLLTGEW
jgi:hypothetical protein